MNGKGFNSRNLLKRESVQLVFSQTVSALTDDDPSDIEGKTFVINCKTYEVVISNIPLNGNIAIKVDWSEPTGDESIKGNINKLMIAIKDAVEKNDRTFNMSYIIIAKDTDTDNEASAMAGKLIFTSAVNMSIEDAD